MSKSIFKYGCLLALLPLLNYAIQPQDVLDDQTNVTVTQSGVAIRKGTIYATILNIEAFNQLIQEPESIQRKEQIQAVIQDIKSVIPALESVQLFKLFGIEEWISPTSQNEGRILVGLLYLQAFPDISNQKILENLKLQSQIFSSELQHEIRYTLDMMGHH